MRRAIGIWPNPQIRPGGGPETTDCYPWLAGTRPAGRVPLPGTPRRRPPGAVRLRCDRPRRSQPKVAPARIPRSWQSGERPRLVSGRLAGNTVQIWVRRAPAGHPRGGQGSHPTRGSYPWLAHVTESRDEVRRVSRDTRLVTLPPPTAAARRRPQASSMKRRAWHRPVAHSKGTARTGSVPPVM